MGVQKNGRDILNDSDINNPDIDGGTIDNATGTNLTLVTPALGTPASGALTNCTGLPAAGLVPGTAESDFICATTTPFTWVKKTLVEAKALLGLVITAGKTITCTQDTSLDEAVAMSSKAPKESPTFTGKVIIPTATLNPGTELIVNGTFPSDISGWADASSAGGSIAWNAAGAMDLISTGGAYARAQQDNMPALTAGRVYKVSVNIIASNQILELEVPSATNIKNYASGFTGTHTFLFVASGASSSFRMTLSDTGVVTVDDVSIQEAAALVNGDIYLTANVRIVIPTFANNAAAIAGGLVAGQFYRVNAATDPEPLYIVH